jgi:hypothetical protein
LTECCLGWNTYSCFLHSQVHHHLHLLNVSLVTSEALHQTHSEPYRMTVWLHTSIYGPEQLAFRMLQLVSDDHIHHKLSFCQLGTVLPSIMHYWITMPKKNQPSSTRINICNRSKSILTDALNKHVVNKHLYNRSKDQVYHKLINNCQTHACKNIHIDTPSFNFSHHNTKHKRLVIIKQ